MNSDAIESAGRRDLASLVLVSFLALFLELALIRFVPGCIKVIGYYTNLVLISSFLGLGLGCAAPPAPGSQPKFLLSLSIRFLVSMSVYAVINRIGMMELPSIWGERVWLNFSGLFPSFLAPELVFVLTAWSFLPLGRWLGAELSKFKPLLGYSLNLAGSVAGVLAFTAMSVMQTSPLSWFGLAAVIAVGWSLVLGLGKPKLLVSVLAWALALLAVGFPIRGTLWSPYYKIGLKTYDRFFEKMKIDPVWKESLGALYLSVNDDFFQIAVNLDPAVLEKGEQSQVFGVDLLKGISDYVEFPYRMHPPGRVLILGSGLGNDVAGAVRGGNSPIDAVEIDPVIARLGLKRHPETPYQKPGVKLHITDARRFLKNAEGPYDLIVFAFLDSHTLLSAHSSIRLDTFVYTRQSFERAARLLSPDGVIVVLFSSNRDFVGRRIFYLVHSLFPESTRSWMWDGDRFGHDFDIIAGGPGLLKYPPHPKPRFQEVTADYLSEPPDLVPTDNWPFLYLTKRSIGPGYGIALAAILITAFLFIKKVLPGLGRLRPHFGLLGAGFLLLETKSITELSLLFGSTWMVNSAVISAFLIMGLAAAIYVARLRAPGAVWIYGLLLLSLLAAFLVPVRSLLMDNPLVSALAGSGLVALPVLFSGVIFACSLKGDADPASALGSNILGAVAGGLLEYISLFTGFKALYLVAALIYAAAFLTRPK